jgi:hypothetical protein
MGLGYVEGVTHDYIRHGTTTLFEIAEKAGPGNDFFIRRCRIFRKSSLFTFPSLYQVIITSFLRVVLPLFSPVLRRLTGYRRFKVIVMRIPPE